MDKQTEIIFEEIQQSISDNEVLSEANSTSKTGRFNLINYICAFAISSLKSVFKLHDQEMQNLLLNQKSGRLSWYRTMALNFQYGYDLHTDSDLFNNLNATEQEIANSKIIKSAAVSDSDNGRILIKIATDHGGLLGPVSDDQLIAITAYFDEVRWAGDDITIINYLPDLLSLNINIYRDPLLLNASGESILNGDKPVEIALQEFLRELPFNGVLVVQSLVDKLQLVSGVNIVEIIDVNASWIDEDVNDYGNPQSIRVERIAVSGYYSIPNYDNISYVV